MKEIKAVIRPNKLLILRDRLMQLPGFPGMTVDRVDGCSAPTHHVNVGPKEDLVDFTPKIRVEIVAPDDIADTIVECITNLTQTGQIGDGLVWVTNVEHAVFIYKTMPGQAKPPLV